MYLARIICAQTRNSAPSTGQPLAPGVNVIHQYMRGEEMKTFLAYLGAAILQVCLGWMPASASDLLSANHNWSGIYVGGQIGGFWSNIDGRFASNPGTRGNSGPSGGIVDMALSGNWKLGLEYRHYEFDDKTITPTLNASGLQFRTTDGRSIPTQTASRRD
jgi:opacity protein-like surface antigen